MEENKKKIEELEVKMAEPDFWQDKEKAQAVIREIQELKAALSGSKGGPYDHGSAVITIFSGAGGDDSEDFSRILFDMYRKFVEGKGWGMRIIHQNQNDHGGFRNLTFEVDGRSVYGTLKNESGVHRLVRLSPFNSKKLRHTSFSMVEVIPKFEKTGEIKIPDDEIEVSFQRSSGPGGQNVNKRETSVRIVHLPTKLSVHVDSERSQAQNKEKALTMLASRLAQQMEMAKVSQLGDLKVELKSGSIDWGSQIRSYVLDDHYVKDHRTGVKSSQPDKVLNGDLSKFIT